jgi:hypothetical protein
MTSVHTSSGAHPASYLLLFTEYWEFLPQDEVATDMSTGVLTQRWSGHWHEYWEVLTPGWSGWSHKYWGFLPNDEVATDVSAGGFLPQDEVAADMSTGGSYRRMKWPLTWVLGVLIQG